MDYAKRWSKTKVYFLALFIFVVTIEHGNNSYYKSQIGSILIILYFFKILHFIIELINMITSLSI